MLNLSYVYLNFKRTNQSCLRKLANQLLLNSALVIEMANNYFSEAIKRGTFYSKKYILLDFIKYLSFS